MNEIVTAATTWLPVPDYDRLYDVSDSGLVRSWHLYRGPGPRLLVAAPNSKGYLTVTLCRDAVKTTKKIHALVAGAFLGSRPAGLEIRHLDGNQTNNTLSNLAYGTPGENAADMVRHGTHNEARKTHCAQGHPFDGANTYARLEGGRRCRTCNREQNRAYNARRAS